MPKESADKIRILIVDDTPENIQVAASILSRCGYEIAFDEDGEKALRHVRTVKFHLILLDILMPGTDGYEVCRRLKAGAETKRIPVIFLTARSDTDSIVKGFEAGAADYVTKPFREAELLARVNTHLELSRHRNHLEKTVRERTRALEVLMEIREEISLRHEEKVKANVYNRVFPMLETLRGILTLPRQKECLDMIKNRIGEITSDFSQNLSDPEFDLTPAEIRVAGLIIEGKSSKQIARLLGISENTVIFHRQNIRRKLGLSGQGASLKAFLKSMG